MSTARDVWVRLALIVSLLVLGYFAFAALGTRYRLFDWTFGFVQMTVQWGPRLLMGAGAMALSALLLALIVPPRHGVRSALLALLVPAAGLGYGYYVRTTALPIHDISTDLADPPSFSDEVVAIRSAEAEANSLDLVNKRTPDGRPFAEVQREAYPDIAPVETSLPPERAFELALAAAHERGWRVNRVDPPAGEIEAVSRTFWFGFADDIAIRVRHNGAGSRVDVRSVSRVGRSDLGANAARLRPYLRDLRARLEEAQ